MGTIFEQDPDELRERGNRHIPVADAYRAGAKGDPDYEATFLERAGYGAFPILEADSEKTRFRTAFMTNRSETHDGVHSVSHAGATTIENADTDGAGGTGLTEV